MPSRGRLRINGEVIKSLLWRKKRAGPLGNELIMSAWKQYDEPEQRDQHYQGWPGGDFARCAYIGEI
jgi:hypothetical protein